MIKTLLRSFILWLSLLGVPVFGQTVFWDDPTALAQDNARFPQAGGTDSLQVGMWQESYSTDYWPQYFLSIAVHDNGTAQWNVRPKAIGPFSLPGEQASFFSLVVAPNNDIWVAVLSDKGQVDLLRSTDRGQTFQTNRSLAVAKATSVYLTPRLFLKSNGQPILFLTEGQEEANGTNTFRITSSFWTGQAWTPLTPVTAEADRLLNFLPSFTSFGGNEYLAYQTSVTKDDVRYYQIYLKISKDGGAHWTDWIWLTNVRETDRDAAATDNQRPFLTNYHGRLHLAWERKPRNGQPQVYSASFDALGVYQNDLDPVAEGGFSSISPSLFVFKDQLFINYFDNSRGPFNLYLKSLSKTGWVDESFPNQTGDSVFGRPIPTSSELFFFWENRVNDRSSVVVLQPDKKADPPVIVPQNFAAGERFNLGRYYFSLDLPKDPSGIKGFNYLWDRQPTTEVPPVLKYSATKRILSDELKGEGDWYVHARVQDAAGNWSPTTSLKFTLDETPPTPMRIIPPALDDQGFVISNTIDLSWQPTTEDTDGYSWRLTRLTDLGQSLDLANLKLPEPTLLSQVKTPTVHLDNAENGWWALTVRTIDRAGNIGEPFSYFFRLNKFRPSTVLTYVSGRQDDFGRVAITIEGRGFTAEGTINQVVIDRDGRLPWDRVLTRDQFRVESDRLIDRILVENLPVGRYRVGVIHPVRGLTMSGPVIQVDETGTIKFGDFSQLETEQWFFPEAFSVFFTVNAAYFWLVVAVLLVVIVLSSARVVALAHEISREKRQVSRFFSPDYLHGPQGPKAGVMQKKGLSLGWKFRISILILTTAVILMLALTLGFFITQNSQRSLGVNLRQKAEVLLDSQVTRATNILRNPVGTDAFDTLELRLIPQQITALGDAVYALVTGKSRNATQSGWDYLWGGPVDPALADSLKIRGFAQGVARFEDPLTPQLAGLESAINQKAQEQLGDLIRRLDEGKKQRSDLMAKGQTDQATAISPEIERTDQEIKDRLRALSTSFTGSWPAFDPDKISAEVKTYLFYQPILYRDTGETTVFKGLVRLQVSVDTILRDIEASRLQLIQLTLVVALVALLLGLVGAVILSNITVNPIRRLVTAVERIRDEEDKSKLKDFEITVTSRDELAQLADTINDMSHGLAKAAEAAKDLTVGKDIQKTFIPLILNPKGAKTTIGLEDTPHARFFGYYEGAKGVSGDYFNYLKLDDIYYAVIKCDVSGKGVPAALIMVQVATVFLTYFRNWKHKSAKEQQDIQSLVYQINDIVASMGFKGRFAAMMIGLLNTKTGVVTLCNAGDTLVHLFNHAEGRFETHELPKSPATGVFDNDFVDMMKQGFRQVNFTLKTGDTLFLYTDGIEEAKRIFRDRNFRPIAFKNPLDASTVMEPNTEYEYTDDRGNVQKSSSIGDEELSPEKVQAIIQSIYGRGSYRLEKLHNPLPERPLDFDFTNLEGTVDDVILGLVAVERIWRLVPDPQASVDKAKIMIDIRIREFLEKHFKQFDDYFIRRPARKRPKTELELKEEAKKLPPGKKPEPEIVLDAGNPVLNADKPEYEFWEGLYEDDQFDDLTLLAVIKK